MKKTSVEQLKFFLLRFLCFKLKVKVKKTSIEQLKCFFLHFSAHNLTEFLLSYNATEAYTTLCKNNDRQTVKTLIF